MTIGIRTTLTKTKDTLFQLIDRRLRNPTKGLGYWGAHDAYRRVNNSKNSVTPKL